MFRERERERGSRFCNSSRVRSARKCARRPKRKEKLEKLTSCCSSLCCCGDASTPASAVFSTGAHSLLGTGGGGGEAAAMAWRRTSTAIRSRCSGVRTTLVPWLLFWLLFNWARTDALSARSVSKSSARAAGEGRRLVEVMSLEVGVEKKSKGWEENPKKKKSE